MQPAPLTGHDSASGALNAPTLRLSNLLKLVAALRRQPFVTRAEMSQEIGLSIQAVHRLVDELVTVGLAEASPQEAGGRGRGRGRPTVPFRFRSERACIAGIDVGSTMTRVAVADLSGQVRHSRHFPTVDLRPDLTGGLRASLQEIRATGGTEIPLIGIGVGVPSVVDENGTLLLPWNIEEWRGTPLQHELATAFDCSTIVAQDNHLAALAETDALSPVAPSELVLVLELGGGIGVGGTLGGRMLRGRGGRFGRLMAWSHSAPEGLGLAGSSLGALLTEAGLMAQYGARGGSADIRTGVELLNAAENEDAAALATVTWAATALADVIEKIRLLADPSLLVVGGGLGRALFTSELTRDLFGTESDQVRASSLGQEAVTLGGLLVAQSNVTPWILSCIESDLNG